MPRANWHLNVGVDTSDPFAETDGDVHQGEPIDLTADPDVLQQRISQLLKAESELYQQGVTCELKDRPDSCCSACPLAGTYAAYGRRELCKVGKQQERAVMDLVVAGD